MRVTSSVPISAGVAAAAAIFLASSRALAANATKEIKTAATHAGFAAKAETLKQAKTHLHHVVNCLVGPKGEGFASGELNPCKGMGDGAIPDAKDANTKKSLKSALADAMKGIDASSLATAKSQAKSAASMLKKAQ
jgi:hypothetical protein